MKKFTIEAPDVRIEESDSFAVQVEMRGAFGRRTSGESENGCGSFTGCSSGAQRASSFGASSSLVQCSKEALAMAERKHLVISFDDGDELDLDIFEDEQDNMHKAVSAPVDLFHEEGRARDQGPRWTRAAPRQRLELLEARGALEAEDPFMRPLVEEEEVFAGNFGAARRRRRLATAEEAAVREAFAGCNASVVIDDFDGADLRYSPAQAANAAEPAAADAKAEKKDEDEDEEEAQSMRSSSAPSSFGSGIDSFMMQQVPALAPARGAICRAPHSAPPTQGTLAPMAPTAPRSDSAAPRRLRYLRGSAAGPASADELR